MRLKRFVGSRHHSADCSSGGMLLLARVARPNVKAVGAATDLAFVWLARLAPLQALTDCLHHRLQMVEHRRLPAARRAERYQKLLRAQAPVGEPPHALLAQQSLERRRERFWSTGDAYRQLRPARAGASRPAVIE
jgi:hypothetical protein